MDAMAKIDVRPLTRLFKALADETRVRIVALLAHGELCVCHIEAVLALPQPTVSRHLAVLRSASVVEMRRDGLWVLYRLAKQTDADCERQLRALAAAFAPHEALRADLDRLRKLRGPDACRSRSDARSRRERSASPKMMRRGHG
jgi:ArsR family transcriptional regulator